MKTFIVSTLIACSMLAAGQVVAPPATNADEIIAKVFVRDRQREMLSQGYSGYRRYLFENDKCHKRAELLVAVKTDANGTKNFEVLNEDGWKSANKRVLRKMLESESETSRPDLRSKTLLIPENYSFALVQMDRVDGRPTYVIGVTPKREDKYLFEGRIWVDAVDFAVVRCEGKPAKNPSFWTRKIHFVHQYQKSDEFWFPHTTESVTDARVFGTTNVVIHYFDYTPNTAPKRDAAVPHNPQNATLQKASYASTH